jgi:uncharacterized cupin superfamily protein
MTNKIPKFAVAKESPERRGSRYPSPYDEPCQARVKNVLGDQFDLTQFGVNLATMPPGTWSAQRHWHETEDEFIYVLEGELVLADDAGEHVLKPGMCAGFKANNGNGHCLKNLSDKVAVYLEIGTRAVEDRVVYSDIDMMAVKDVNTGGFKFVKRDGSGF